ncbi:MFS transporter [Spongiactinospora gelatinilytica]|uniref:MFS transporter n=1 Tax=Spongiactinospora gelatinilytica TaxID=2666298 RepID=A0A2W2GHW0_9ACTN|nr:MFS transporter [Spongiactinospora gelatinilytica]PZG47442.1 MFS transporter [Spongiactinospora gelatinilytica]
MSADTGSVLATWRESPLAVKTLLAGIFVNRLSGFLNIFLVLYLTAQGYSPDAAAFALGAYGAGAMVGTLLGGSLAARLGTRNTVVIGMAGSSVMIASLLYLNSYGVLLAAVALAGLTAQMFRPASATLLSQLTPDNRQVMVFAMSRFGINLGATAAPLIGFGLYNLQRQRYDLLFWGEALIALVFAAVALFTLPGRAAERPATDEGGEASGSYLDVLRDRRYLVYLISTLVHTVVYGQYLSTLPLDVKASGVDIVWYTVAVSLNGFIVIAFELLTTKVTQSWPMRVTIGISFALMGAGIAVYALPMGPAVIVIGTLVWSIGEIIGGPAIFAYPALIAPARAKSHYLGGFHFVFGLGSAIGPVVGGWLLVKLGHGVWVPLAIVSLAASLVVVTAIRRPQPTPENTLTGQTT